MTKDEIKNVIIKQILEIAPDITADEIAADANIQRSLEIDSFDFLKILTALNEELEVEVPESDYSEVATLEKMADYFLKRL
ncbi:acyl carrier protein [Epsilonproteobacteria bacterium SCGC AD-308-O04]|jgi:acyl carrier protein|nr:acyl carrier protein [Epsilonproteobacteria bacterium SCGC AD-308-O04]